MNLADLLTDQENRGASAVVGALARLGLMRYDSVNRAYRIVEGLVTEEVLYEEVNRQLGRA